MRIALVSESFYPAVDGTTTTVRAVADRLVDTGHQVLVVAPGRSWEDAVDELVTDHYLPLVETSRAA